MFCLSLVGRRVGDGAVAGIVQLRTLPITSFHLRTFESMNLLMVARMSW